VDVSSYPFVTSEVKTVGWVKSLREFPMVTSLFLLSAEGNFGLGGKSSQSPDLFHLWEI
jgi:hypothetical protein